MNYNDHSNLSNKHATLSPSTFRWAFQPEGTDINNYISNVWSRSYAQIIGTALHDIARKQIKTRTKLNKFTKQEVLMMLTEDYRIPRAAISLGIDFDMAYENLTSYVNDAIGYLMNPEQILYYSMNCFGTADAISFRDNVLRIHDLKTGIGATHMEQLIIYAALFCLEYKYKPEQIKIELRIYQMNEIQIVEPDPNDTSVVMKNIIYADEIINKIMTEV